LTQSNGYTNDAFTNRALVYLDPYLNSTDTNNAAATAESGEPAHGGLAAQRSLWWQWTAPASGILTVDTVGSSVDARLGVYTGSLLNALMLVASDDNSAGNGQAKVQFAVSAGMAYQIAVDSSVGGDMRLNWFLETRTATQSISFPAISNMPIGAAFALGATASSGLPISYNSQTPAVCSLSGGTLNLLTVGVCTVTASQFGNTTYLPATSVAQSFNVAGTQVQSISFPLIANQTLGNAPFAVSATASSGLTVAFNSTTPVVCSVSGNTVTLLAIGTCSVVANQAGDATFATASQVTRSFSVTPALVAQTITFPAIGNRTLGSASFTPTVSASSGLPVSLLSYSPSVCSVSGNTVTLLAVGTCTVEASQAGNGTYTTAMSVIQTFNVVTGSTGGGGSGDGDVPLPAWALLSLAMALMGAMSHQRRRP
jgi:hypothetical protein